MESDHPEAPRGIDSALWQRLARAARERSEERGADPAHDFFHVTRVVGNAIAIARGEDLDAVTEAIAATAALLHELFNLPKSHPESSLAGDLCAEHARVLLGDEGAPLEIIDPICSAIRDHAFSKGVNPHALASRVLQDADRLDALGAIGLARMWATCSEMKRPFYSPVDPFCAAGRVPDDKSWGLDHLYKKLLRIPERIHLGTSRRMAHERTAFLRTFVTQLERELGRVSKPATEGRRCAGGPSAPREGRGERR